MAWLCPIRRFEVGRLARDEIACTACGNSATTCCRAWFPETTGMRSQLRGPLINSGPRARTALERPAGCANAATTSGLVALPAPLTRRRPLIGTGGFFDVAPTGFAVAIAVWATGWAGLEFWPA